MIMTSQDAPDQFFIFYPSSGAGISPFFGGESLFPALAAENVDDKNESDKDDQDWQATKRFSTRQS
jgi:hypothetical protein